ncbi:MAG: hypothetical protein AAGF12_27345 [Myxococcota bacterium]
MIARAALIGAAFSRAAFSRAAFSQAGLSPTAVVRAGLRRAGLNRVGLNRVALSRVALSVGLAAAFGCTVGEQAAEPPSREPLEQPPSDQPPPEPCLDDYGSCDPQRGCPEGSECTHVEWEYGAGTICTRTCEDDFDCPTQGGTPSRCLALGTSPEFRCYRDCVVDEECSLGHVCQPLLVGRAVCLP